MSDENIAQQAVTSGTRHAVWNDMLDASRMSRYAEKTESRYRMRHLSVRFGLLLSATASVTALKDMLPDGWRMLPELAIATLIIFDFLMDYATKIAALNSARRECQSLENDWRDLWQDVDSEHSTDADIRKRNKELLARLDRAVAPMDLLVKVNEKINVATTADAYNVTRDRYATR